MVCKACEQLLLRKSPYYGRQLSQKFIHHQNAGNLRASKDSGCYICSVIHTRLERRDGANLGREDTVASTAGQAYTTATLNVVPQKPQLYRLDFQLTPMISVTVASFILKELDSVGAYTGRLHPVSVRTDDPQVIALAKKWTEDCAKDHVKCRAGSEESWYPTRLIDLKAINAPGPPSIVRLVSQHERERLQDNQQPIFDGLYVTMSHRWGSGSALAKLTRLTIANRAEWQQGLHVSRLPKTFREGIRFAFSLGVRWIWIDAMCILQNEREGEERNEVTNDWLHESAQMRNVYLHSYCNISATAALDSTGGLFHSRDVHSRWADEVTISWTDPKTRSSKNVSCLISDLSFWSDYVDDASVNTRAWVFQERLLSPRVVHWCESQVLFECRQGNLAECRPESFPNFQLHSTSKRFILDQSYLKAMDEGSGRELFLARRGTDLSETSISELPKSGSSWYFYEHWKSWVEAYSKLGLSHDQDRLIALSGVARWMDLKMKDRGCEDHYLAGLWEKYLVSHLLWFVNTQGVDPGDLLVCNRPTKKGAPSFSWASVETLRGVNFPESTDQGLLAEVQMTRLIFRTGEDSFGMVTDGYLIIKGLLRRVEVTDLWQEEEEMKEGLEKSNESNFIDVSEKLFNRYGISSTLLAIILSNTIMGSLFVNGIFNSGTLLPIIVFVVIGVASLYVLELTDLPHKLEVIVKGRRRLLQQQRQPRQNGDQQVARPKRRGPRFGWALFGSDRSIEQHTELYLDSPADKPSVFGTDADVYLLPVLQDTQYLHCLLLQATFGDYGVRYQRVGYTRVDTYHKEEVESIRTAPGNNKTELGRYYKVEPHYDGYSYICII